jgi:hypothetical protein
VYSWARARGARRAKAIVVVVNFIMICGLKVALMNLGDDEAGTAAVE